MVTSPWTRFLLRRAVSLAFILVVLVIAVFGMVQLIPGDPVVAALGGDVDPDQIERIRRESGFDLPLVQQFWHYVTHLFQGDLGRGFATHQPVGELIAQRVGNSLELAGVSLALVLGLAVPIGMGAAALTREGRHPKIELVFTSVTSILSAVPDFLMGTLLAFFFAVQFKLLPVSGAGTLEGLILPALAIAIHSIATLSRIVRVETLNVLAQDYIRTAKSKRLPGRLIFFRHALPNVVTAALTVGGLIFASIIGGAVVVENVFNRSGLGTALVAAVIQKDYSVIQGITLVLGVTVVAVNALVDILLAVLDPRSLARHA